MARNFVGLGITFFAEARGVLRVLEQVKAKVADVVESIEKQPIQARVSAEGVTVAFENIGRSVARQTAVLRTVLSEKLGKILEAIERQTGQLARLMDVEMREATKDIDALLRKTRTGVEETKDAQSTAMEKMAESAKKSTEEQESAFVRLGGVFRDLHDAFVGGVEKGKALADIFGLVGTTVPPAMGAASKSVTLFGMAARSALIGATAGISLLIEIVGRVISMFGEMSDSLGKVDVAMRRLTGEAGVLDDRFGKLGDRAAEMAEKFGMTLDQTTELTMSFTRMGIAGDEFNKTMQLSGELIGLFQMAPEQVESFVSAARATNTSTEALNKMLKSSVVFSQQFGVPFLIEDTVELMEEFKEAQLSLAVGFRKDLLPSMKVAQFMTAKFATTLGMTREEAVEATKAMIKGFVKMAEEVEDVMSGLADGFSEEMEIVLSTTLFTGQDIATTLEDVLVGRTEKTFESMVRGFESVSQQFGPTSPMAIRARKGIERMFGKESAMILQKFADQGAGRVIEEFKKAESNREAFETGMENLKASLAKSLPVLNNVINAMMDLIKQFAQSGVVDAFRMAMQAMIPILRIVLIVVSAIAKVIGFLLEALEKGVLWLIDAVLGLFGKQIKTFSKAEEQVKGVTAAFAGSGLEEALRVTADSAETMGAAFQTSLKPLDMFESKIAQLGGVTVEKAMQGEEAIMRLCEAARLGAEEIQNIGVAASDSIGAVRELGRAMPGDAARRVAREMRAVPARAAEVDMAEAMSEPVVEAIDELSVSMKNMVLKGRIEGRIDVDKSRFGRAFLLDLNDRSAERGFAFTERLM